MSKKNNTFELNGPNKYEECIECKKKEICQEQNKVIMQNYILHHCESFYNVYMLLTNIEKNYRENLFESINNNKYFNTLFPKVVNGDLAVEYALKYLIFKENKKFRCIHNLEQLFDDLSEEHKSNLIKIIKKNAHQNEETLRQNLKRISNVFIDFRYPFDLEAVGISNFFDDFVKSVCEYVLQFKEKVDL